MSKTTKTTKGILASNSKMIVDVDVAVGHDRNGFVIIDTKDNSISSRVIRTDNPDPNSWMKNFFPENLTDEEYVRQMRLR